MANWCHNSLVVRGGDEHLRNLIAHVHGQNQAFSFQQISPEPDWSSDRLAREGGEMALLAWRCLHWGTKWDIDIDDENEARVELVLLPGKLEILYTTAWAPSFPISEVLATRFPYLSFDHIFSDEESGMGGRIKWKSGKIVFRREYYRGENEFDVICRGVRPEESGVQIVEWTDDIPLNSGLAISKVNFSGRNDDEDAGAGAVRKNKEIRGAKVRDIFQQLEDGVALARGVEAEVILRAVKMGFPFETWRGAGLDDLDENWMWGGGVPQIPLKKGGGHFLEHLTESGQGGDLHSPAGSKIVLRESAFCDGWGKGDGDPYRIRFLSHGVEFVLEGGWSVSALIKDGGNGYVITKYKNEAQNWTDGEASCVQLTLDRRRGQPFRSGEAHCVDGKLWNPSKDRAAVVLWFPNGQTKVEGRFFNNENISKTEKPSLILYGEDGQILKRQTKIRLPKKTHADENSQIRQVQLT